MPVRVKVQPSNTPDKPPSLLSSTAKKIMDSLQSSGSPLKDARRLPMRQLSDEDRVRMDAVSCVSFVIVSAMVIVALQSFSLCSCVVVFNGDSLNHCVTQLPTKRRRVIDSPTGGGIVSPPPVTPLRSLQSSHHHLSTPSYSQSLPRSARQEVREGMYAEILQWGGTQLQKCNVKN